jgi:hypothetical protein
MHPVTITFQRVFDVVRRPLPYERQNEKFTAFSFEANSATQYGVEISGWPPIEAGMTVTALLEKEGDWHSLVGWFDHKSNNIVCQRYLIALFLTVGAVLLFLLLPWEYSWQLVVGRIAIAVATLAGMTVVVRTWRARRILQGILKAANSERHGT